MTALNEFTLRLYRELKSSPGNLVFSGASLRSGLGIAYLGARGDTAAEMARVFEFSRDVRTAAAHAKAERAQFDSSLTHGAELSMASRLWGDGRQEFAPGFVQLARDAYGAAIALVDFQEPEATRQTINDWTAERTHNRILDLLPPGSVGRLTGLVITNAVSLQAFWVDAFAKSDTRDEPFYGDAAPVRDVPMMHQTRTLRIAVTQESKILELPYRGGLAMLVVLPEDRMGLEKLEQSFSAETLGRWTRLLREAWVRVSLPKFAFAWEDMMKPYLESLGVHAAFSRRAADFSGIVPDAADPRYIGSVRHKAFVRVDELGTEAAVATGVGVVFLTARPGQALDFTANRPFSFFIRHTNSGSILLAGRVTDPR